MMGELWIFAYGSLIWRPGFSPAESVPARLSGWHRRLCIYSHVYRGTPARPGLVFGLAAGGWCDGLALRAPAGSEAEVRRYLFRREQVRNVYRPAIRQVVLMDAPGRSVSALVFLADTRHRQYAGALAPDRQAAIVRRARGAAGSNLDYVLNTAAMLAEYGLEDAQLRRVLIRLGRNPDSVLARRA
jgi:cation transport protein ChaC